MKLPHLAFAMLALAGCAEEADAPPADDALDPATLPREVCLTDDTLDESNRCDFQAQTGCAGGRVCLSSVLTMVGNYEANGFCASPCDEGECATGFCSRQRWGRCPNGSLCQGDYQCEELEALALECDPQQGLANDNCLEQIPPGSVCKGADL